MSTSKTSRLLATLLLTISICAVATAQTSPAHSPASASPAAGSNEELSPDQVIRLLIDRLNEERKICAATKKERDEAVAAYEVEKKNSASLQVSYNRSEEEISRLDKALEHQERAAALYEKAIATVEKQRDDAKKDAKRSRKIALIATLITIAKIAGAF